MNIKCKQCGKPFEAQRQTAKYCSDSCRVAFNRDSVTNSVTEQQGVTLKEPVTVTEDVTVKPVDKTVKSNDLQLGLKEVEAHELYKAIKNYPGGEWIDSPEYQELGKRLERLSVKELEAGGYYVPNWKKPNVLQ